MLPNSSMCSPTDIEMLNVRENLMLIVSSMLVGPCAQTAASLESRESVEEKQAAKRTVRLLCVLLCGKTVKDTLNLHKLILNLFVSWTKLTHIFSSRYQFAFNVEMICSSYVNTQYTIGIFFQQNSSL